ncbi:aminotransferase class V-fold PLP-dependent enzyme [Evansella clarkii]|uniref:aminotransferase class V-fold PLP-dependent enzyme n=1 Tax=Evansella clarkii TaxID=79879 RepID=UPI000B438FCD|nr:aminotransferase class V-fold PLP-dependent enzyme [Evansella clarkii]
MIYFDQAASSFPKPEGVAKAMAEAVCNYGANPGRGGHALSRQAAAVIEKTRKQLADMFHADRHERVLFSQNATTALNQAIQGLEFSEGDEVITTSYEHNSVRRPLERIAEEKGVKIIYLTGEEDGRFSTEQLASVLTNKTKLVAVTHGSNLTGTILPIEKWGDVLKDHPAFFLVDASQTAGVLPINMKKSHIDMLAFPGHKGLMGPQGTGVLIVQSSVTSLRPLITGGTGSHSEEVKQPEEWPAGWESGTLNTPGIAGLSKGIDEVLEKGIKMIYEHERKLATYCIGKLEGINETELFGPGKDEERLGVVAFRIPGIDVHEMAMILDEHYGIAVRAGLHCSPLAHEYCRTGETGLVRVSFGLYNTEDEIDTFINAVREIKEGLLS